MTGCFGAPVPPAIQFAVEVIERLQAFRNKWAGKMSKEADDLSAHAIQALTDLRAHCEEEIPKAHKDGYERGLTDAEERVTRVLRGGCWEA